MRTRNYFLTFFAVLLLFACNGNKNKNAGNIQASQSQQEESQNSQDTPDVIKETDKLPTEERTFEVVSTAEAASEEEKEAMKQFLYENDGNIKKYNYEILFIERANFGIPYGDNWIIQTTENLIFIYAVTDTKIERRFLSGDFNPKEFSSFDIMKDIPGTHIGDGASSFGDFNGDGVNELFKYQFLGRGTYIIINKYDSDKDKFTMLCEIPFDIIEPQNGPAPVKFMTYKGMYGLKVFFAEFEVAGGPGWVSEPNPKNKKWFFYTWDAEKRKYVEVGEVVEEEDKKQK